MKESVWIRQGAAGGRGGLGSGASGWRRRNRGRRRCSSEAGTGGGEFVGQIDDAVDGLGRGVRVLDDLDPSSPDCGRGEDVAIDAPAVVATMCTSTTGDRSVPAASQVRSIEIYG